MQNHLKMEEVTLEPTPPLKRIYTPPSIKVLFPLNQCKSSFRKFKTNSIKTYTFQYNKNMIHNLSDHKLTDQEFSVLTKGLSFVPTPTKTFKQKTYKCWDKFKTRILTQYFFRNSTHDKPPHRFKGKSNWTPPPSDNPTLIDFFTHTEQDLISTNIPRTKTYSNLTSKEKSALNNLKNNQSIVIKPCDKGGGICIMNTGDYLTKIHAHLQDCNIQTNHPQPNKCNSQWYMHSHRIHALPAHNWQSN